MRYDLTALLLAFVIALGGANEGIRWAAAALWGGWMLYVAAFDRGDLKDLWFN